MLVVSVFTAVFLCASVSAQSHSPVGPDTRWTLSAVGDVIMTEQPVASGLQVFVDDRPAFRASPGAWEGQRAVVLDGTKDDQRSRDS